MARSIDQQIATTQAKLARLKQRQKASETRRKIIVGAIVTTEALKDPKIARWMAATLRKNATRDVDQKELVGLLEELDQVAGVCSGWGRNPTLRGFHRFFGHLYSPVRRMCAHPRGEMWARRSAGVLWPSCFRLAAA